MRRCAPSSPPAPTCSTTTSRPSRACTRTVRPQARYERSLELLARAAAWAREPAEAAGAPARPARHRPAAAAAAPARPLVKTGLMVGLGETADEVDEVLAAAAAAGVDAVTIGQYLQPDSGCLPVARYVTPEEFEDYERRGAALGLTVVAAPFVRSSYRAGELLEQAGGGAARAGPPGRVEWPGVLAAAHTEGRGLRPRLHAPAPERPVRGARLRPHRRPLRARAGRGALAAGGARRLRGGRGTSRAHRTHPRRRPAAGDRPRHHRRTRRGTGGRRRADGRRDHRGLVAGGELRPLRRRPAVPRDAPGGRRPHGAAHERPRPRRGGDRRPLRPGRLHGRGGVQRRTPARSSRRRACSRPSSRCSASRRRTRSWSATASRTT